MSKKFLTNIDLTGNQLINSALERLASDPVTNLVEGRVYYNTTADAIKVYDGTAWVGIGEITTINGTTNEVDVTVTDGVATISLPTTVAADISGNAATASKWSSSRSVTFATGDVTGSFSIDGSANVADVALTIAANSVALGTDTTGNYVATIAGTTDQVSVSGSGSETAAVTLSLPQSIATTSSPTFAGATLDAVRVGVTAANEIDTSAGNLTIDSAGGTVTVDDNLVVSGDLTVNGTTTTLNTTELAVEDNIITLNSNVTGTPALNAGIAVERGTSPNVELRWNETNDKWEATLDGTNYANLVLVGDDIPTTDITNFVEDVQDAIGTILTDGNSIDFTYTDATPSITAEVKLATTSYLSTSSGLTVDISSLETKLRTDAFTKKVTASVGNGSNTSFAVTHNLGTRDVQVQVYDNATYDTVETDVVRTDANNVTVSFATAPSTDAYRVVVIG